MRIKVLFAALFLAVFSALSAQGEEEYAEGQVLVKFRAAARFWGLLDSARMGAEPLEQLYGIEVTRLRLPDGVSVERAVNYYRSRPFVEFAEPNYVAYATIIPNDTHYGLQWGLPKIGAPAAWDVTTGVGVRVSVLDTGWDTDHPDLFGKVVVAQDFTVINGSPNTVEDGHGHGTHTAGTVGASTNNGTGVAAIGFNCDLMIGKVLSDGGSGYYSEIANGITWSADSGAKVINMSLGGSSPSSTLESAVNYAWNAGAVVVAAAGNTGNTRAHYPAYYTNCVAVAATDQNDRRASFSTYGSWVDCAAPGVDIASTYIGGYAYMSGTSMASPHVAGLTALVWTTSHGTSNSSVRTRIETTGDSASGFKRYPTKRINAARAVGP